MMHAGALPGRPRHDADKGMPNILDALARDLDVLQRAGVDGLLFCNEADLPYQLQTGPEVAAAMAALIGELKAEITPPVRHRYCLGSGGEPGRGPRHRGVLRPRGGHRGLRERPGRHAARLRDDQGRSEEDRRRGSQDLRQYHPGVRQPAGPPHHRRASPQRRLPGRRRSAHHGPDHRPARRPGRTPCGQSSRLANARAGQAPELPSIPCTRP